MLRPKRSVSPSGKVDQLVKALDEKLLKYNSPQSPTYGSERDLRSSTPPPRKLAKRALEENYTDNECVELMKDKPVKARPPPLPIKPPKKQHDDTSETLLKHPVSPSERVDQIIKALDEKLLKYNFPPQSPTYSSKILQTQNELKSSTSPPVLPTKWVKTDSEQRETGHEYVEIIKEDKPVQARPPPLPIKQLDMTETLPKRPVFSSGKVDQMVKALDEKLKYNSPPQSPTYSSENELSSTPPSLLPRKWVKPDSEQYETIPEYEEIMKDSTSFSESCEAMTPWSDVCRILKLKESPEAVVIDVKAELLYKAFQLFNQLMTEHGGKLEKLITELHSIADNIDKVSMGTKIAGLTGAVTTMAGGLAATAAGVILSPVTAGASLAVLTAVGVGVAAAGGITRVSATIANQANLVKDKKKIDKTLQDIDDIYKNILGWLKFINDGMELLKQHGLSVLKKTARNSTRVANMVTLATGDASEMSSRAVGIDFYFTDGKTRMSPEPNLAKNLRNLAEDFDKGLSELMKIKDVFSELDEEP